MSSPNYRRVSRRRLCRICGKSDWCSYTPDEKVSFCARVARNADRVSRTGWGVFYHEKSLFGDESLPFPSKAPPKKPELAPLEIRDFAYRKLIHLAPATDSKEIVDGPKGLRARKILDFENYGSLPQSQSQRRALAGEIRNSINRRFPDFVKGQKSSAVAAVVGIPGFWIDKSGNARLWKARDYAAPLMLIPYRDENGFVQACQIRFMCRAADCELRYVWLSTPDEKGGASCGSPLHFASNRAADGKPVLVTEGALKAETARVFKPDFDVIASGGVMCSHEQIVAAARSRPLLIGFDGDYAENRYVARAFARLLNFRLLDGKKHQYDYPLKILNWSCKVKGIDDALLGGVSISEITPVEWLASLSDDCRQEVEQSLSAPDSFAHRFSTSNSIDTQDLNFESQLYPD